MIIVHWMIQQLKYLKTANQKILLDATSYCQTKKILLSGMTIDHDDNIYCAMFGGGKIIKVNTK